MKNIVITILLVGILGAGKGITNQDTEVNSFDIELKHFFGAAGYTVKYLVNQDSLKLRRNCDFPNCKDTLIYQIKLEEDDAKKLYSFLVASRFDTLKNNYITDGEDGRQTFVKISGDSLPEKMILLEDYNHDLIEQLIDRVDLLIPEIKYRLYRYKYKEDK